jgi:hypothetical protein
MRVIVGSAGLLAALVVAVLSLPSLWSGAAEPKVAQPEPTLTPENASELCRRLFEEPKEYIGDTAQRRRWALRDESCQFQDRPGACKLIETAVSRGDQTMTQRLSDCRAS